jgi:hypothetical protein
MEKRSKKQPEVASTGQPDCEVLFLYRDGATVKDEGLLDMTAESVTLKRRRFSCIGSGS